MSPTVSRPPSGMWPSSLMFRLPCPPGPNLVLHRPDELSWASSVEGTRATKASNARHFMISPGARVPEASPDRPAMQAHASPDACVVRPGSLTCPASTHEPNFPDLSDRAVAGADARGRPGQVRQRQWSTALLPG